MRVHDDVEPPELAHGVVDDGLRVLGLRDVGRHAERAATARLDLLRDLGEPRLGARASTTSAPSSASRSEMSRPMPGPMPETSATLPSSSIPSSLVLSLVSLVLREELEQRDLRDPFNSR